MVQQNILIKTNELEKFIRDNLNNGELWEHLHFCIADRAEYFTLSDHVGSMQLWGQNGLTSICYYNSKLSTDENIKKMVEYFDDYLAGFIHCSDCGKKFPAAECAHYRRSYFAGRYCQDCWDNKWKAIEAKETYD